MAIAGNGAGSAAHARQMTFICHVQGLAQLILCFLREWRTVRILRPTIKTFLSQERAVRRVS
jgi:hypothetical protein